MLEKHLEKKVVEHCRRNGIWCRKFSSPNARGVPDRILAKNGKILFVEVKAPGKKPTTLQYREMQILASHGIKAIWINDYEQAVETIDDFFTEDVI